MSWTLSYNPASQIVSSARSNDLYATALAATDKSYTVNGLNQYTDAGGAALAYDANGNLRRIAALSKALACVESPIARNCRITTRGPNFIGKRMPSAQCPPLRIAFRGSGCAL